MTTQHDNTDVEATLLVVDDEPNIRELLSTSLRFAGFDVVSAANGADALRLAEQNDPDLLVLDVMLPDIDGFTLCARIREEHFWPIIMLTAKVEDIDKIMGLTIGADDYITKPFNPLELVARVKTQLRRYTRYNQADAAAPRMNPSGSASETLLMLTSRVGCQVHYRFRPPAGPHPPGVKPL